MTIQKKFKEIAILNSDYNAIAIENELPVTYKQLDDISDHVGFNISTIMNSQVIGICIERSVNMIVALLGILKSGTAFLPIDPYYPDERINYMIANSQITYVICSKNTKKRLAYNCKNIFIEDLIDHTYYETATLRILESSIAYILYTSGSTGDPHGVIIEHDAILNTINWRIKYYGLSSKDAVLQIPSLSFDSSIEDIFCTLLSGGQLILFEEKEKLNIKHLKYLIDEYRVSHFLIVPSFYKIFLSCLKGANSIRFVTVAGESFTLELVKEHYNILPNAILYNEYGPTENSVCSTIHKISLTDSDVFIGRPIDNVYILIDSPDENGIGELLLSGKGLAKGYHNNPVSTKNKFKMKNGVRYYYTGDFARVQENGLLKYFGRQDSQIKINGKRIDLNEIDKKLQNYDDVLNSVTSTITNLKDNNEIISFVKTDKQTLKSLKERLSFDLPPHYMPQHIIIIKDFRYLPNGKIDIKSMKESFIDDNLNKQLHVDDVYKKIVDVLHKSSRTELKINDYFEDVRKIGLDSISFIKFLANLEETFEFEFGYDDIDNIKIVSIDSLYNFINGINKEALETS